MRRSSFLYSSQTVLFTAGGLRFAVEIPISALFIGREPPLEPAGNSRRLDCRQGWNGVVVGWLACPSLTRRLTPSPREKLSEHSVARPRQHTSRSLAGGGLILPRAVLPRRRQRDWNRSEPFFFPCARSARPAEKADCDPRQTDAVLTAALSTGAGRGTALV
jgi:hypothetical protein